MKRVFKQRTTDPQGRLTPIQLYMAGGIAGVANSLVSGPVEHIRTRMQVQTESNRTYASTADCFRQIRQQYGWRGVYKGQVVTMLREWQGYGGYFLVYELLVQRAVASSGKPVNELPMWQVMSFGACAGYGMWLPVFPIVRC